MELHEWDDEGLEGGISQQDRFEVFGTTDVREAARSLFGAKRAARWLRTPGGDGACNCNEAPEELIGDSREDLLWEELMRRAHGVTA